jgi:AraC family transcriptional regulator
LYLSASFLSDTLGNSALEFSDSLTLRDPFISAVAVELVGALERGGSANSLYAEALVTAITHRVGLNAEGWSESGAAAALPLTYPQRACIDAFIEAHLDQRMSLAELAASVGVSNWHFLRRFSATYGTTPHEYLIDKRCEHAARMLRESSLSITQIALEVGLSHSHFSRTFLQRYALSPSEFRVHARATSIYAGPPIG